MNPFSLFNFLCEVDGCQSRFTCLLFYLNFLESIAFHLILSLFAYFLKQNTRHLSSSAQLIKSRRFALHTIVVPSAKHTFNTQIYLFKVAVTEIIKSEYYLDNSTIISSLQFVSMIEHNMYQVGEAGSERSVISQPISGRPFFSPTRMPGEAAQTDKLSVITTTRRKTH